MKISLILGVLACFSIAYADQETLVLVDNLNIKETHSQFFKSLQGNAIDGVSETGLNLNWVSLGSSLF